MPAIEGLRRARLLLWIAVGVAALALPALVYWRQQQLAESRETPALGFGGPFTLIDSTGKPFSSASLDGRPRAMFFGFTHCPDVCPTTLARLARLRRTLGKGDDSFAILFISVDPERDTPTAVGQYASLFDTPVIGLTGTPTQIDQVRKSYGIYAQKVPQEGGDYSVDHSAAVLLFDRSGGFAGTIAPDEGDQAALDKLGRITA